MPIAGDGIGNQTDIAAHTHDPAKHRDLKDHTLRDPFEIARQSAQDENIDDRLMIGDYDAWLACL